MNAREVLRQGQRVQVLQQLGVSARSRVFVGDVQGMFGTADLLRLPPEVGDPLQDGSGNLFFVAGYSRVSGTDRVGG